MSEHVRRQVYLLSEDDLIAHPVWEFCSDEEGVDGQDEATVRPIELREIPESPGEFIVSADVIFADNTKAMGYFYSGPASDLGCIQPNVVCGASQVNLWIGSLRLVQDSRGAVARAYVLLGKNAASTFPITFRPRVAGDGIADAVILDGFRAVTSEGKVILVE